MMDQRELESTIRQLQKTVAANEAASNVVAILERLKKEASPTEDMLRSTRAGVYVGKLRQNSNRDIARLANELVIKWKRLVESEKSARMQKLKQSSPATPSPKPSTTSLPAKAEAASPQKADEPFKGNPETRKHSTDGISTSRTGDAVRDSCLGLIYNGLAYKSTLSADSILKRAVQVEEAAFKSLGGTNDAYKKKCRTLFHNLKNNRDLSATVLDGSLASQRLVEMSTEELKSAEQRKKEDALQIENMKKAQVPMAEKSISDALKCGKCQQKKVSYTQAQTRSADEPMTTFCECTVCGNRWKFS